MIRLRLEKDKPMDFEQFKEAVTKHSRLYWTTDILQHLERQLRELENKYEMTSEEFYKRYLSGELEDTHEFTVWAGRYWLYEKLKEDGKVRTGYEG